MVVKTVFFVSRGHLCTNDFLFLKIFKFFSCFQTLREIFWIFSENNFVENNLYLWLYKELFFLWTSWVSLLFSNCGQKNLQHCHRNFRECIKSAFYLNNRTFRGKFVFSRKNLLLQFFRVLMKNSPDFCQEGIAPICKTAFYTGSGGLLA